MNTLCFYVRGVSFLGRIKLPEAARSSVDANCGNPLPTIFSEVDTHQAGFVALASPNLVLHVRLASCLSQIGKCIAGFVAVEMVKFSSWPFSSHEKPSQPVRSVGLAVNHEVQVSDFVGPASASGCAPDSSRKHARLGIVVEQLSQSFSGKHPQFYRRGIT